MTRKFERRENARRSRKSRRSKSRKPLSSPTLCCSDGKVDDCGSVVTISKAFEPAIAELDDFRLVLNARRSAKWKPIWRN